MADINIIDIKNVENRLNESSEIISRKTSTYPTDYMPDKVVARIYDLIIKHPVTQLDKLKVLENHINDTIGDELRVTYFQCLIYYLYIKGIDQIECSDIPESIVHFLKEDFSRIIDFADKANINFLTFHNRTFLSYIEKLCFRSYPIGNQDITLSGIPRSLALKQGIIKGVAFSRLLSKTGGNYPFFEMHYNPHRFRYFNQDGWNDLLACAAEMLAIQKNINGLFGSAWFFDTALKELSPEIFYIYQTFERAGASFFYVGATENDKKNAFLTSKARRDAHKKGKYNPASYIMILPRKNLLSNYS